MYLLCLNDFNEGGIQAKAGDVCEFAPIVARRLLDSWPGCWSVAPIVEVPIIETVSIDAPPEDKMMRKAKAKRRG